MFLSNAHINHIKKILITRDITLILTVLFLFLFLIFYIVVDFVIH